MTALSDLQAAVADLVTSNAAMSAAIDALLAKITAPGTSDADVEAIVTQIRGLISANTAELAKITP